MNFSELKGMKYPDEYFIKYFFKNNMHTKNNLKFLELGSSNGNNLMLPYEYNFDVIGVDLDKTAIDDAKFNFTANINSNATFEFHHTDLRLFAKNNKNINANIFMLPNIVNYIKKSELKDFFLQMIQNNNISKNASIFIRCRTPKDFRFGIGKKIEHNTYKLPDDFNTTGESACLNTFYDEYTLISLLKECLNLRDFIILKSDCQNPQNENTIVFNSDLILWGTIN